MWVSITQLPHAGQSVVEECGEAVYHPEAKMICNQEWKDTATAALSSQNTSDPPEIRPWKDDMEEIKFSFSKGFLPCFIPGSCLIKGTSDFKIHNPMFGKIEIYWLWQYLYYTFFLNSKKKLQIKAFFFFFGRESQNKLLWIFLLFHNQIGLFQGILSWVLSLPKYYFHQNTAFQFTKVVPLLRGWSRRQH